jgi:hypothetical protein
MEQEKAITMADILEDLGLQPVKETSRDVREATKEYFEMLFKTDGVLVEDTD